MPPRSTCSAIGFCSAGNAASAAFRCVRPARSRLALGFGSGAGDVGRFGWWARVPLFRRASCDPSPSARGLRSRDGRPSRFSPSPSRRGLRSRRSPRPFGASFVVTSGSSSRRGVPTTSMRSGSLRAPFGGRTAMMSMPSIMKSASARTTSPTFAPAKSSEPLSSPFGNFAPAARQVQVPSSRVLVSSTSMRRDIGGPR